MFYLQSECFGYPIPWEEINQLFIVKLAFMPLPYAATEVGLYKHKTVDV